jgi:hypothetical protein
MTLTPKQLRTYAVMGAALRLREVVTELQTIRRIFPELRGRYDAEQPKPQPPANGGNGGAAERTARAKRKRLHWTQRPENAAKVRRMVRAAVNRARRMQQA